MLDLGVSPYSGDVFHEVSSIWLCVWFFSFFPPSLFSDVFNCSFYFFQTPLMIYLFHFTVDYAEIVFIVSAYFVDCLSCFLKALDRAKMSINSNYLKSDLLLNFPGCCELISWFITIIVCLCFCKFHCLCTCKYTHVRLCHQIADGITALALYLSIQTYNKDVVSYSLYFCWYLCIS